MELPDSEVPSLVLGSKLAFMNWIWYLCFIWSLKGILLNLYAKMAYVLSITFTEAKEADIRRCLDLVFGSRNGLS